MIKLKIIDIDKYEYILEDKNNNKYNLNIEFYMCENMPKIGDYIYLNEKIIDKKNLYTFGPINNDKVTLDELIKIVSGNNSYYLKRYYG